MVKKIASLFVGLIIVLLLLGVKLANASTNMFGNFGLDANISGWDIGAVPPSGWIEVPGSSTYSTSNFLAMKYEAKCALNSSPTVGLITPANSVHGYINNASQGGITCTSGNSRQVVSVASGYPIVSITQNTIDGTYCGAVSVGSSTAHLITNSEWMTIARNIEAQPSNWSLGAVGSGYLIAGHSNTFPAFSLPASTNDTGNFACAYTDGNPGSEYPSGNCPTNTANGQSATAGIQKRVHVLSNGSYIWDLAGNQNEYVGDTVTQANEPDVSGSTGTVTSELTALTSYGTFSYDLVRPLGTTYDSSYGVGRILHHSNSASGTVAAIFRGGGYNNGLLAGIFAMRFDIAPNSSAGSGGIGFRCATNALSNSTTFTSSGYDGGGMTVTVGTISDAKVYQTINTHSGVNHELSVYVYDLTSGHDGGTVDSTIAQLYNNGAAISTSYENLGGGWWKLTGRPYGTDSSVEYGLLVKTGKTVKVDNWVLSALPEGDNKCFAGCSNDSDYSQSATKPVTIIEKQNVISMVNSGTFNYNATLSISSTPKTTPFKLPNSKYWQVGPKQEVWWKSFSNGAKILPSEIKKTFTLIFKYDPAEFEKTINEKSLKLAYSLDGKKWKIVQSVLDTKKRELIVVTKNGGYYMIVGGGSGALKTTSVQGAKTEETHPTLSAEESSVSDRDDQAKDLAIGTENKKTDGWISGILNSIKQVFVGLFKKLEN